MLADQQIAALIILPVALIGVICNWTVALFIRTLPSLKNSFGRLTASQSFGDALHSTLFLFYFVPMCFFDSEWMKANSIHCGQLLLIAYDISTYSHFCISLNRFCSIVSPIKYDQIFNEKNTNLMVAVSWALAIFPSFYLYVYQDCRFYYFDGFWVFLFSMTPVCMTITWYADFLKYNSIVISIVIIDIITVSKVRHFKDKMLASSSQSHVKRRNSEMNFLKQACLQAFVFVCELITYFVITPKVGDSERWTRFFLSTFAWVCVHTCDGIITLMFNKEFTKLVCRKIYHENSSQVHRETSVTNTTRKF